MPKPGEARKQHQHGWLRVESGSSLPALVLTRISASKTVLRWKLRFKSSNSRSPSVSIWKTRNDFHELIVCMIVYKNSDLPRSNWICIFLHQRCDTLRWSLPDRYSYLETRTDLLRIHFERILHQASYRCYSLATEVSRISWFLSAVIARSFHRSH